jgi:uncharacterized membrane protein YcfT
MQRLKDGLWIAATRRRFESADMSAHSKTQALWFDLLAVIRPFYTRLEKSLVRHYPYFGSRCSIGKQWFHQSSFQITKSIKLFSNFFIFFYFAGKEAEYF